MQDAKKANSCIGSIESLPDKVFSVTVLIRSWFQRNAVFRIVTQVKCPLWQGYAVTDNWICVRSEFSYCAIYYWNIPLKEVIRRCDLTKNWKRTKILFWCILEDEFHTYTCMRKDITLQNTRICKCKIPMDPRLNYLILRMRKYRVFFTSV